MISLPPYGRQRGALAFCLLTSLLASSGRLLGVPVTPLQPWAPADLVTILAWDRGPTSTSLRTLSLPMPLLVADEAMAFTKLGAVPGPMLGITTKVTTTAWGWGPWTSP